MVLALAMISCDLLCLSSGFDSASSSNGILGITEKKASDDTARLGKNATPSPPPELLSLKLLGILSLSSFSDELGKTLEEKLAFALGSI